MLRASHLPVLALLFNTYPAVYAQNAATTESAKNNEQPVETSWISNGEDLKLGSWWLKNPLKYDPMPTPLLYHLEGVYNVSETSGNVEASVQSGRLFLMLRKGAFSSLTRYNLSFRDTKIPLTEGGATTEDYFFRQGFRYAFTDVITGVIGGSQDRNSAKYLNQRDNYYLGVHLDLVDTPALSFESSLFYGNTTMEFMNSSIQAVRRYSDFPSVEDFETGTIEFFEQLEWKINDNVSLSQLGSYGHYLKDEGFYAATFNVELAYKLTKYFSLVTGYDIKYEKNPFTQDLQNYLGDRRSKGLQSGDFKNRDTVLSVGIKFTF